MADEPQYLTPERVQPWVSEQSVAPVLQPKGPLPEATKTFALPSEEGPLEDIQMPPPLTCQFEPGEQPLLGGAHAGPPLE